MDWMGEPIETLKDLLRPGLDAVCVGINPTPTSVAADAAFAAGVGFTDVVKRPTSNVRQLRRAEFDHGRQLLAEKLAAVKPKLVIVTFREAAERLFGKGAVPGVTLAGADVFVMPGRYERDATVAPLLDELAAIVHRA